MDGHLEKPVRARHLQNAIRAAVAGTGVDCPAPTVAAASDEREQIDWNAAREAVGGKIELLRLAVDAASQECPRALAEIRRAIDEDDANSVRTAAHTLKGTLRHFGATRAYDAAVRLEILGRDNRLEAAPEVFHDLASHVSRLQAALSEFRPTDS
jgi:HPt (histidine-containing phosphotransfer) domain-containing protein